MSSRPPATFIRLAVQLPLVIAAPFVFGAWPTVWGGILAFCLAVIGLWLGRLVFARIASPDEKQNDLRHRVDSND